MKKDYSLIHKPRRYFAWAWPLIILIGLIVSMQSFALSFVRENDLFSWPLKEFAAVKTAVARSSEKTKPEHGFTQKSKGMKTRALPLADPCTNITTLPCEQVNVTLPFNLNFDGNEGGLADKNGATVGFTMVGDLSGTPVATDSISATAVPKGYKPSRLTVADGKLNIRTNSGIAFQTNNNQVNALGAGILADGRVVFETTVINPFNGTKSEQAGLWVGLNDKTFLKLSISGNKVEMRKELNDASSSLTTTASPDQRITGVIDNLNLKTVRLRMVADFVTNTLEGYYSTDGVAYANVGTAYTSGTNPAAINIADMALAGKTIYAGIYATHRTNTSALTYSFDNFSIKNYEFPMITAPYRINAGGIQRTVGSVVYNADDIYARLAGNVSNVSYTGLPSTVKVPELYYERRLGSKFSYYLPIANGRYTVNLHFVENFQGAVGGRIFDVNFEGNTLLDNLDIFSEVGKTNVLIKTIETQVSDGVLNIDFIASKDNAIINAIEILPVTPPNEAPVFASATYSFNKDEATTVGAGIGQVSATDAADQTVRYSITAGNQSSKFAIDSESGAITLAGTLNYATDSVYVLTVQATDNAIPALSSSAEVTIRVNKPVAGNHTPVAALPISDQNAVTGTAFTYNVAAGTFTDEDSDPLTYTASLANDGSLPSWLSFDAANLSFSGTPDAAATYRIKLTANDGKVSASTEFNLVVNAAAAINHTPVAALPISDQNAVTGTAFTYNVAAGTFTDEDSDPLTYTASLASDGSLPSWLSFDAANLSFSGTPDAAATYRIKLTANDGKVSASTEFNLVVNAAAAINHAPVAALPLSDQVAVTGTAFTYNVAAGSFTDEDSDALTYTA
ncbi:putative Ig domain-containing protein, partial [Dyadobacter sediminis]